MVNALRVTAVILGVLALSGTSRAADSSCPKNTQCPTNVLKKGTISGNASKKDYVIRIDSGQLNWVFRHPAGFATVVNVGNFNPNCPGDFAVDGITQSACGFTLSWNQGDATDHVVTIVNGNPGTYKFHVYSRDNADDDQPKDIDPQLQIDGGARPTLNIGLLLSVLAALGAIAVAYRLGYSRGRSAA